jgi:hypothetical protein
MTYLDRIGAEIRQLVPPDLLPPGDLDALFRLYAVLALAKGDKVSAADVHNAWTAWMQDRRPEHTAIKRFDELDRATQALDEPFAQAIRTVAGHLKDLCRAT